LRLHLQQKQPYRHDLNDAEARADVGQPDGDTEFLKLAEDARYFSFHINRLWGKSRVETVLRQVDTPSNSGIENKCGGIFG
jgi:hypothetical protein